MHFAGHGGGERGAPALVMNRHEAGLAQHVEELAGDVRIGADAGGAVVEFARRDFASAISSLTERTGSDGCTDTAIATVDISEIGAKSVTGS